MKNKHMHGSNNENGINKDRKEWSKEWGLEKQTEGLDKKAVEKQEKIGRSLENESKVSNKHHEKTENSRNKDKHSKK